MSRRLGKVKIEWSSNFAYGIGLIATDGNLSPDGRHIHMTSKDLELVTHFKNSFNLSNKITKKSRGGSSIKKYFVIQFGDKNFYEFLLFIGLAPAKSKVLGVLDIPSELFKDFLRGCIDGDGSIGFFNHPESKYPQLRIRLCSASRIFLQWIKSEIKVQVNIKGGWIEEGNGVYILIYAKSDSLKLVPFLYSDENCYKLERKFEVIKQYYGRVAELV